MSSFTAPLILAVIPNGGARGRFAVHEPFVFDLRFPGSHDSIYVEKGFETDLCTWPWFLRVFFTPAGKWAKASIVHDKALRLGRADHAAIFDEALQVANVSPFWRVVMVWAVARFAHLRKAA